MAIFHVAVSNAALSTTDDFLTLTAGSNRSLVIYEMDFTGMGTTSAANEIVIFGVTTVGVTPTSITPTAIGSADSPVFTAASAWVTEPVVNTIRYHTISVNANGGRYFWRSSNMFDGIAMQGGAIALATRSFRSISGTSNVSGRVRVYEV